MTLKQRNYLSTFALLALGVAAIDQVTKALILNSLSEGEILPIIGDWFRFKLLFNPGAAFSFGTSYTGVFTCIQIVFILGATWAARKLADPWQIFALALVAGGAAGNLIDRLFRAPAFFIGHVVDFISVGSFAVFNIADSAITCGVVCYILAVLTEGHRGYQEAKA